MTTVQEISSLLEGLGEAKLDQVKAFVEFLRSKDLEAVHTAWCFDFLENFKDATVDATRDTAGMQVLIADASCEGQTLPALWQHPPLTGASLVTYLVPIPMGLHNVKLKFSIGIRDGAELPDDRFVAFRVLVNGWKLWSTVKNSHVWEEHQISMPQLASNLARVEFATDGLGHHEWDWAVWGIPRLEGEKQESR